MEQSTAQEMEDHWIETSRHEPYFRGKDRSGLVVDLISEAWPDTSISILEPGCNVGRNLHYLMQAGYEDLTGVEISPRAFPHMQSGFSELSEVVEFHQGKIERYITEFENNQFDVVLTMAFLMHIHPESEWIFEHLARIARLGIMTVEEERTGAYYRWARNYRDIFEGFGARQDFEMTCEGYSALSKKYLARRFIFA